MRSGRQQIRCAGALVFDAAGRLLLVQRGKPPEVGRWSVPGGKCLPHESAVQAAVRETREETGLDVVPVRHAGRVLRAGPGQSTFLIDDFVCELVGGHPAAADDAAALHWADRDDLDRLPLTTGLLAALLEWDLVPR